MNQVTGKEEVLPYRDRTETKKQQVSQMFDNISSRYDLLNHVLSLGIDRSWRRKAIARLKPLAPRFILDVATGTGDLALQALSLNPEKIWGVDISEGMLAIGKKKISQMNLSNRIELGYGDSENLPFEENKFDAVTVAFGVRNFEDLKKGLREINRVLRPGGVLVVLEFARPRNFLFRKMYHFYFNFVLPKIGRWISRDKAAYTYLPESVQVFPDRDDFTEILRQTGFNNATWQALTFGISAIYTARK